MTSHLGLSNSFQSWGSFITHSLDGEQLKYAKVSHLPKVKQASIETGTNHRLALTLLRLGPDRVGCFGRKLPRSSGRRGTPSKQPGESPYPSVSHRFQNFTPPFLCSTVLSGRATKEPLWFIPWQGTAEMSVPMLEAPKAKQGESTLFSLSLL